VFVGLEMVGNILTFWLPASLQKVPATEPGAAPFVVKGADFLAPQQDEMRWRERVEVESTTRSAKERVAGFEGREGHRTPFAPTGV